MTTMTHQQRADAWIAERASDYRACRDELHRAAQTGTRPRLDALPEGTRKRVSTRLDADPVQKRNDYAIEALVKQFIEDSALCRRKALRADSGETLLLTSMLKHYVAEYVPTLYIPNRAARDFPVVTSYPRGAKVLTFRRMMDHDDDDLGIISGYGDDIKFVEIGVEEDTFRLLSFGRGFRWTIDELESAAFGGVDLPTDGLAALNRAADRVFEKVALQGVSNKNIAGMYNDSNITITAEVTGTWSTASHDEIVGDVRALVDAIKTATLGEFVPNRLRIPDSLVQYLAVQRTYTDPTVRETLGKIYPGLQLLEAGSREDEYDASSSGPRLMAYAYDPRVAHLAVPLPFSLEPPEKHHFNYDIVGRQTLGGAVVTVPLALGYMDDC